MKITKKTQKDSSELLKENTNLALENQRLMALLKKVNSINIVEKEKILEQTIGEYNHLITKMQEQLQLINKENEDRVKDFSTFKRQQRKFFNLLNNV